MSPERPEKPDTPALPNKRRAHERCAWCGTRLDEALPPLRSDARFCCGGHKTAHHRATADERAAERERERHEQERLARRRVRDRRHRARKAEQERRTAEELHRLRRLVVLQALLLARQREPGA